MKAETICRLLLARHRCIRIIGAEESECIEVAVEAALAQNLDPYVWSVTSGVRGGMFADRGTRLDDGGNPAASFGWMLRNLPRQSLVIALDLADQLTDTVNLRAFRDLLEYFHAGRLGASAVIMIDHHDRIPPVVGGSSIRHEISAPSDEEITRLIREAIGLARQTRNVDGKVTTQFLHLLVQNLRGLTRRQVRQSITACIMDDGALTEKDLAVVQATKRGLLENAGVLEFVDAPASLDDIGGLVALKQWLRKRESLFGDSKVAPPRGLMLLGVQGAGKSLAAKAIATAWKRPLMRLDPGSLFNKYIGETERNLRDALSQAEAMAPVVLWIDEIEKGFASTSGEGNDGGVGRRMFGTLLTWMQEHTAQVFLVATANDIEALPPELLRKGRFDEIFFVNLPLGPVRRQIFSIHLRKRGQPFEGLDLDALAHASDGFSGAEIEQAVINACIDSSFFKKPVSTDLIIEQLRTSPPLSVTMAEKIACLRKWAVGRCVPAD